MSAMEFGVLFASLSVGLWLVAEYLQRAQTTPFVPAAPAFVWEVMDAPEEDGDR